MVVRANSRGARQVLGIGLGLLLVVPVVAVTRGATGEDTALSSCGYLTVSDPAVTTTTVPLTSYCTTCPNGVFVSPLDYDDNMTHVHSYVCVTPGL